MQEQQSLLFAVIKFVGATLRVTTRRKSDQTDGDVSHAPSPLFAERATPGARTDADHAGSRQVTFDRGSCCGDA
jgi:hypothetical protein